jgi:hypothetical protein
VIFVIGAGRTGTTVVAKVLQERLGVDMGGPGFVREGTPEGDYEEQNFKRIARDLWTGEITAAEWRAGAEKIAVGKTDPWGVKYPGHCEFLPLIMNTFPQATWIWCQREIHDTWQSWLRYFQLEPEEAWARLNYRNWAIQVAMLKKRHVEINATERLDEGELETALVEAIELLAPGYLNGNLRRSDD